ncbi:hypothetical protein C8K18_101604 [Paraburkholderia sp. GV068]|jgi:hypothetical protein|nr:hypothetical protein CUJ91_10980 [Paraburkholderia graminis]PTR04130.1 hypothetical protein C8K19_101529 [Paraburkholderia sp. GV072]PUB09087.1 hypothetical protein C8K18_101604 [Paraburkholderia sp. GV068]
MTISTIEYREYELCTYSHHAFLLHRDPYAKGPRQFPSFVRYDVPHASQHAAEWSRSCNIRFMCTVTELPAFAPVFPIFPEQLRAAIRSIS